MKSILLIYVKMPTIVDLLAFWHLLERQIQHLRVWNQEHGKYGQEMPQSHTEDQPTAPREKDTNY